MVNKMSDNMDDKAGKVKEVKQVYVSMEEDGEELDVMKMTGKQKKRLEKLVDK